MRSRRRNRPVWIDLTLILAWFVLYVLAGSDPIGGPR